MNPDIEIIASTGRSDEKRMQELTSLGVAVCLSKPYNRQKLLLTMSEAVARSQRKSSAG
jgi:CheY-like chemotaxis protein